MEKQGKILIVDDEADIREILQFNLENAGYEVDCASSAEEALEVLGPEHSLILLDVMMDGMSGFKMAEVVRKERDNQIPIIFLTARSAENDLLTGFSAGAVMKRAASYSAAPAQDPEPVNAGHLKIDVTGKMVYADGVAVVLSKKEFEILSLLASHQGRVYSREEIIGELWKDAPYVLDRTVDVHIARIRNKLGEYKKYITNRSGYGYCFNVTDKNGEEKDDL